MQQDPQKREETIGSVLADARDQVGLSQEEIAGQMNLMVSTIQALEEDNFANLPGPTYVRGYLHTYCKLVGLDAGQLIRNYNEQYPAEPEHQPPSRPDKRRGAAVLWTTAAVIVLAGVYVFLQVPDPQPSVQPPGLAEVPGESLASQEEVPEVAPEVSEASAVPEAPSASEAPEVSEVPEVSGASEVADARIPESVENPQTQGTPVAEANGAGQVGPPDEESVQGAEQRPVTDGQPVSDGNLEVLTMTFMDDCWIEIRDADMQLLHWDLMWSGAALEIEGKAPFEVLLGNSPGVVIHIDGKRFDHSRFHQSDRTSRFKVAGSLVN
ncbi:MAG: helix-turn-helix domain-containing protein [Proteobacteria bacterium]|nr:helix-turn-helix domain-containing protein [Pseudomonadota bacterium]